MRRLTRREQNIFIICVLLVFVYGGYHGMIRPLEEKGQKIQRQIDREKKAFYRDQRTLRKARYQAQKFAFYQERFQQAGSKEQVSSSILGEVESVAADLGMQISDLKPRRVEENELFNRFPVSLTIDSPFGDIMKFLYILQREPYFYYVEDLRFDKAARRKSQSIKTRLILSKILIPAL